MNIMTDNNDVDTPVKIMEFNTSKQLTIVNLQILGTSGGSYLLNPSTTIGLHLTPDEYH